MLEQLAQIDQSVFYFINVKLANPVTDLIMPLMTSDWNLRVLYAVAMAVCIWKGDRRLRWLVLFSCLTLALTDQVSSMLLKEWIGRPRPCHVLPLDSFNLLVNCGAGKSMPSSHAANCFGQAVLFGLIYTRIRWELFGFAFLVSISRIFVGVHCPGDVLVGILVGSVIGVAVVIAWWQLPVSLSHHLVTEQKNTPRHESGGFKP